MSRLISFACALVAGALLLALVKVWLIGVQEMWTWTR